jgi:hypothetical protein
MGVREGMQYQPGMHFEFDEKMRGGWMGIALRYRMELRLGRKSTSHHHWLA